MTPLPIAYPFRPGSGTSFTYLAVPEPVFSPVAALGIGVLLVMLAAVLVLAACVVVPLWVYAIRTAVRDRWIRQVHAWRVVEEVR